MRIDEIALNLEAVETGVKFLPDGPDGGWIQLRSMHSVRFQMALEKRQRRYAAVLEQRTEEAFKLRQQLTRETAAEDLVVSWSDSKTDADAPPCFTDSGKKEIPFSVDNARMLFCDRRYQPVWAFVDRSASGSEEFRESTFTSGPIEDLGKDSETGSVAT